MDFRSDIKYRTKKIHLKIKFLKSLREFSQFRLEPLHWTLMWTTVKKSVPL